MEHGPKLKPIIKSGEISDDMSDVALDAFAGATIEQNEETLAHIQSERARLDANTDDLLRLKEHFGANHPVIVEAEKSFKEYRASLDALEKKLSSFERMYREYKNVK